MFLNAKSTYRLSLPITGMIKIIQVRPRNTHDKR